MARSTKGSASKSKGRRDYEEDHEDEYDDDEYEDEYDDDDDDYDDDDYDDDEYEDEYDDDDYDDYDDDEDDEDDEPAPRRSKKKSKGHDDEEEEDETADPNWWIPYAVLGTLVLIGTMGLLGFVPASLPKALGIKPVSHEQAHKDHSSTDKPASPTPPTPHPSPKHPTAKGREAMNRMAKMAPRKMLGASHILVSHKEAMRHKPTITRTKAEAKKKAEALLKKLKKGADFAEMAKKESDGPSGVRGGDLGTFPAGRMVPQFSAALVKLKVGQLSGVVETPFGYHLIKRTK